MIVFDLNCKKCDSSFEAWFSDSNEFKKQKEKKLVLCPTCNSSLVSKSLMTPNVSSKSNAKKYQRKKTMINNIKKYKEIIEKNFDYVGDNFTEEAKKIKYNEAEERPIYGEASLEQTKELIEEDISFAPLPWTSIKKSN